MAQSVSDKPSLIVARTHIGYGSPNKQDTWHAHGEPLGEEEVRLTKQALGWIEERPFHVPERALEEFRSAVPKGAVLNAAWQQRVDAYRIAYPASGAELMRLWSADLPKGWETSLPEFHHRERCSCDPRRRRKGDQRRCRCGRKSDWRFGGSRPVHAHHIERIRRLREPLAGTGNR